MTGPGVIAAVLLVSSVACSDPNEGRPRHRLPDGRVAIGGPMRVMDRHRPRDWVTVSNVRRGERRYLDLCAHGLSSRVQMYVDPALTRPAGSVAASTAAGACSDPLALVWDVVPLDSLQDAVRVEFLANGRIGWVHSGRIGENFPRIDCGYRFEPDQERVHRCREGPPLWPSGEDADSIEPETRR